MKHMSLARAAIATTTFACAALFAVSAQAADRPLAAGWGLLSKRCLWLGLG